MFCGLTPPGSSRMSFLGVYAMPSAHPTAEAEDEENWVSGTAGTGCSHPKSDLVFIMGVGEGPRSRGSCIVECDGHVLPHCSQKWAQKSPQHLGTSWSRQPAP